MKPDIIFIDDTFDNTVPTKQQKENLHKFCEQVLRDRVNPPKKSDNNRNDNDRPRP